MVIKGHLLVPIPVPAVRPLNRRSLKRFIRLLPSALLLLFVASLIFVTLMQIAVFHANRQFTLAQLSSSSSSSSASFSSLVQQPQSSLSDDAGQESTPTLSPEEKSSLSESLVKHTVYSSESPDNSDHHHHHHHQHSHSHQSSQAGYLNEPPYISDNQIPSPKPVSIDLRVSNESDVKEEIILDYGLQLGGHWEPALCIAKHKVAIIIPYRDRENHLNTLLNRLHPMLQKQLLSYQIFVVEQFGNDTFNKGVLMNSGAKEALKDNDFDCFIFHDVDLIPLNNQNLYSCPSIPRHMSVAVDKFNYTLPYKDLVGGVFAISKAHLILVNGYSNLYWGWGGEDDDMAHRLRLHELKIVRPPESIGRYHMIKHKHRVESPNNVR